MSKSNKKDVGKGIRALLANIDKTEKSGKAGSSSLKKIDVKENQIQLDFLEPNPFQPRRDFDAEELEELKESIATHGIIQPLAVRKLNEKKFQIISGERRWRAAKELKLKKVPVHILKADDQAMLEIALLENIQRADLNPIEIALSYQRLITDCKLTHKDLSERLGKKRSSISNYLRLLKLSPSVQEAIKSNQISMGHAKVLAGIDLIEKQTLILGKIIAGDLSVRATEALLKTSVKKSKKSKPDKDEFHAEIGKISDKLSEKIGSKIKITRDSKGRGNVKIPFNSDKEFNDIIDILLD